MSNKNIEDISKIIDSTNQPLIVFCKKNLYTDFADEIVDALKIGQSEIVNFSHDEGVETLRESLKEINFRPLSGKKKVFFIFGCDQLNMEASNTLLKVLEEPPEYARIILFAQSTSGVIPTVASRCRKIRFSVDEHKNSGNGGENLINYFDSGSLNNFEIWLKKAEKNEAIDEMEQAIAQLTLQSRQGEALYTRLVKAYLQIASSNVNHRLVLENLFIWWKAYKKK
jgi:DNA polymerase III delta prime subunit